MYYLISIVTQPGEICFLTQRNHSILFYRNPPTSPSPSEIPLPRPSRPPSRMATRSCRKASPLIRAPAGQFQCICQGGALKPFLASSSRRRAYSVQTSSSPSSPPSSPSPSSGRGSTARYVPPRQAVHVRPQPRAPFPIRQPKPFAVNDDPAKLDEMYATLLGEGMRLPSEVKWQAVTHKSFDHGRQPFNEKLAVFGMLCLFWSFSLFFHFLPIFFSEGKWERGGGADFAPL